MEHKKRFWIWIAIVVVLIVLALGLAFWKKSGPQKASTSSTVVTNVSAGQLPLGFPVNIPFEQGALIVSNFNAATQNGQFQSTRSFKSSKTTSQNISLYTNFLATAINGWTMVASSTDQSGGEMMIAKNGHGLLTVHVSPLPPQPMPESLVEITYVTNPPAPIIRLPGPASSSTNK